MTTRRTFLGAALAAGALAKPENGLKLGVASYSFRKLTRAQAIAAMKELKTPYINIKEFHLRYTSTPEEIAAGRKEFQGAGLEVLGGGNIDLKGDEATLRKMFDYAKAAGFPLIVCAPARDNVHIVEKLVKEYNIKAAIHNHGPEDKQFPSPQSVLELVKNMDPRVGLCIDIGHTARTGVDVVESIRLAGPRLLDLHVKDLKDLMVKESQCVVGEGAMPIQEIFATLKKMKFTGGVMLEYEIDAENPLPGMLKSFANMRRVLSELKS
ncbi:MAG: sugar phosphate isomerase/epimerase [Acidimicrobiia bacterium]|nr:sugar phosphate isomerase/epimerase [Acidimicrobiia bacterium]